MFTFGNTLSIPTAATLAPALETLIQNTGTGFMAACFANPAAGRTMYQGHLFQGSALKENLPRAFRTEISGRIGLVPQDITAAGTLAIRARLSALKDQGIALALVDALNAADCAAIAEAFANITLTAGPAWISNALPNAETTDIPPGPIAILSGALDRQSLFQIGAAAAAMPVLQLDFTQAEATILANALAWAAPQPGSFLIAASAPPDRVIPGAPAAKILAAIAAGLAASGIQKFILAGNDTAATILHHLGETSLTAGAATGALRWLHGRGQNAYLLKPGGAETKNLYLSQIGPQLRLNAAAE
jgi:uncharacterized protein YgbK (DUF1537 family)